MWDVENIKYNGSIKNTTRKVKWEIHERIRVKSLKILV